MNIPGYPDALAVLNDTMRFAASRQSFEIKNGVLINKDGEKRKIVLVALRGTNRSFDKNDVLSLPVCCLSALSKDNVYYDAAKRAVLETVPEGSELLLAGHSLGGMIAQQLAADSEINSRFKVTNLLTIGSPFVKTQGRSCPLRRFADCADFIPWIGRSIKANLCTEKPVFKCNGYFGRPVLAHTDSYRESDSWREYDSLGIKNGGNIIVFD